MIENLQIELEEEKENLRKIVSMAKDAEDGGDFILWVIENYGK